MLAGRKLLLADDSITIQKVVDLTFADEGVSVVCVNNGREAIDWLQAFTPDIVLADVFMPQVSGYEVCEYIKQNEKLKHIPVMLLVGSFEPFDEEEARRVGANETLTKPFQSIRRLIDRVGHLVGTRPPEEQIPTAELPKPDETPEPVEKLSTAELEITTADTKPLPVELEHVVAEAAASQQEALAKEEEIRLAAEASFGGQLESDVNETAGQVPQKYEGAGEVLLDLGDYGRGRSALDDEFVLDIDLDETPEPSPAEPAFSASAFRSRDSYRLPNARTQPSVSNGGSYASTITAEPPAAAPDQLATTEGYERILDEPMEMAEVAEVSKAPEVVAPEAQVAAVPTEPSPQLSLQQ
ncbi:MAG TPA: response regulator, partial [Pyrinomonadaceae bacterium]|nr:response regulator [Pyrinomonadaceae bacterium]